MSSSRDLLIEIGMEEVPARFLPGFVAGMREAVAGALLSARLEYGEVRSYGAPRRVAVLVEALAERQPDREVEARGPSAAAAFDAEGRPTKAAAGFARGQGVAVEDLVRKETAAGEYVFARRVELGRPTAEIVPAVLPQLLAGLQFPRLMRWGEHDFPFVRPIRWLLCLFGAEALPVSLPGLPAGLDEPSGHSRGHRFLAPGLVKVPEAGGYVRAMREAGVIVDPAERQALITDGAAALAAGSGGTVEIIPDLLEELVWLAEHPYPVRGSFDPRYLGLPEPILTTSMRHHQRFFPVRDGDVDGGGGGEGGGPGAGGAAGAGGGAGGARGAGGGKLAAHFVAVRDGGAEHIDTVRKGYETVLGARLADADFFFSEDRKRSLADGGGELVGVTYHERLGTMTDKTRRLRHLAAWLSEQLGLSREEAAQVDRAALLAKCDLVTRVVREFPVLQGVIGGEYARLDGEDGAVATAINLQYSGAAEALSRLGGDESAADVNASSPLRVSLALAVADRADALVGHAYAGVRPTGSEDPYGMRRAAQGVVSWLDAGRCAVRLDDLAGAAARAYEAVNGFDKEQLHVAAGEVRELLTVRLEALLAECGCKYDEIAATVAATGLALVPARWVAACRALGAARREPWFEAVIAGGVRAAGLGAGALAAQKGAEAGVDTGADAGAESGAEAGAGVRAGLFVAAEEADLHTAWQEAAAGAAQHLEAGRFIDYWRRLVALKEPLDRFLDRVLVMAPEPDLRRNRLALCAAVYDLYARAGDMSKLVVTGQERVS